MVFYIRADRKAKEYFKLVNERFLSSPAFELFYIKITKTNKSTIYDSDIWQVDYIPPVIFKMYWIGIAGIIGYVMLFGVVWHWYFLIPLLMASVYFIDQDNFTFMLLKKGARKMNKQWLLKKVNL